MQTKNSHRCFLEKQSPKTPSLRRISSAPDSLYNMSVQQTPLEMFADAAQEIVEELEFEAVTKTPAFIAGACMTTESFPADLLNVKLTDDDIEVAKDIVSCISSPPDGECTRSNTKYKLSSNDRGVLEINDFSDKKINQMTIERWLRARRRQNRRRTQD